MRSSWLPRALSTQNTSPLFRWLPLAIGLVAISASAAGSQPPRQRGGPPTAAAATRDAGAPATRRDSVKEEAPVVTNHSITVNGQVLRYKATVGMMPIRDPRSEETEGNIFYVYYEREGRPDGAARPLTFVFNGGPGSATVWLHMGAYGPRTVKLLPNGDSPPPPYSVQDNQNTLLDQTDLVFLDPVGTGFSRATSTENGPKFWGLDEDARSVTEFIRIFLSRNEAQ